MAVLVPDGLVPGDPAPAGLVPDGLGDVLGGPAFGLFAPEGEDAPPFVLDPEGAAVPLVPDVPNALAAPPAFAAPTPSIAPPLTAPCNDPAATAASYTACV